MSPSDGAQWHWPRAASVTRRGYESGNAIFHSDRRRPHSTIDYQIPAEKMDAFLSRLKAATRSGQKRPLVA